MCKIASQKGDPFIRDDLDYPTKLELESFRSGSVNSEGYETWSTKDPSTHLRGRTPERVPRTRTDSRKSSVSSTRSMIDQRMEWANEERSRSLSRPVPEPASPFRESSPYHPGRQKSQNDAWGVPSASSLPETSEKEVFNTQGSLDPMIESDHRKELERYVTGIGCLKMPVDCL